MRWSGFARSLLVLLLLTGAGLALAGCNTVEGAGKDIQAAGEAGQELINKATR